ncbi:hypothetical protein [Crateriforma conspicua]|uniref:Uncharacterized protein n=1 Tax=Crateriforma conspicua TaxID=2527996 RepID=A0A5C6G1R4_9PLAN|nr:hypothetical protein [Crateriforma conspicua]TWU67598.1 hypothetical protein V7x_31730 [Crateriforma conspicua]
MVETPIRSVALYLGEILLGLQNRAIDGGVDGTLCFGGYPLPIPMFQPPTTPHDFAIIDRSVLRSL